VYAVEHRVDNDQNNDCHNYCYRAPPPLRPWPRAPLFVSPCSLSHRLQSYPHGDLAICTDAVLYPPSTGALTRKRIEHASRLRSSRRGTRAWFRDVVLPSQEVWVTLTGLKLTAMMVIDGEWLEQLYVAPEHSRQGHGSRLVRLAQSDRSKLALWTFEANLSARAFYEKHGFRPTGDPSSDNEEHTPAICYRWTSDAAGLSLSGR
jgi:GNAT superfamily N-acetyltransferase